MNLFQFNLQAENTGSPALTSATHRITVHVIDVNDHKPYFPEKEALLSVPENEQPGTTVGHVTAKDDDRDPERCYKLDGVKGYCKALLNSQ